MSDKEANLLELFSSIQGEGLLVGVRQVFIRFRGCNLKCSYCDTETPSLPAFCRMEVTPGRGDFVEVANPVSLGRIIPLLEGWSRGWPGIHHSISITGGEPLLFPEFLMEWLPELRKVLPIYLETNGVLPAALLSILQMLDHISMDIKLPSTSGCSDQWDLHEQFLRLASEKNVYVKVVAGDETEDWEIQRACETIVAVDRRIPFIIQPVTRVNGQIGLAPVRILEFQEIACRFLEDVRVIPQTHKFAGLI
jgi:7-carboxy-7-deazaguanine synthase